LCEFLRVKYQKVAKTCQKYTLLVQAAALMRRASN
jgi:hypothetical protein